MEPKVTLDLRGKYVLVTGASRGIGRETAIRMGLAGARVAVNYNRGEAEARAVAEEIGDAVAVRADLGDPHQVETMIDEVGRIDVLVNNAATFDRNPFDRDDYDAWQRGWRRTFDVNVFGAANAAFLAMRSMRQHGGGKIINVASRAAFRGETEFADYGASKAALVNLTRSIARGCAKDNIVASCVAPGFIETEMLETVPEKVLDSIRAQVPIHRLGRPADVARLVGFLCADAASYITGQVVAVNGGQDM